LVKIFLNCSIINKNIIFITLKLGKYQEPSQTHLGAKTPAKETISLAGAWADYQENRK